MVHTYHPASIINNSDTGHEKQLGYRTDNSVWHGLQVCQAQMLQCKAKASLGAQLVTGHLGRPMENWGCRTTKNITGNQERDWEQPAGTTTEITTVSRNELYSID